jgi:hypothetical protein
MTKSKCFSSWFVGSARALALDAVSGIILYVTTALGAGRVWRFPFDDEISTLTYVQSAHSMSLRSQATAFTRLSCLFTCGFFSRSG